jgi:DNA-directed RNA polymerase subunit K/omega
MSDFEDEGTEPYDPSLEGQSDDESSVSFQPKTSAKPQSPDSDSDLSGGEDDDDDEEEEPDFAAQVEDDQDKSDAEEEEEDEDPEGIDAPVGSGPRASKAKSGVVREINVPQLTGEGAMSDVDSLLDSDDEDDEYMQRFQESTRDNLVEYFHPESRTHNFEEVNAMTRITRDGTGAIADPLHRTLPFMTKYEKTRLLGIRAKQLNDGASPFVDVPTGVIDGYTIALMELEKKALPFIVRRPLPSGASEYWRASDLELI